MPVKSKKYWEFKAKSKYEADLFLYVEIASWGDGASAHSAQSFKRELDALGDIKLLNIYINSPGGDVFEGNVIYNILKRKADKCAINVYVDGLAASIASVIAMAGNKIIMPNNAMMMIHNVWTYTLGNANELREMADALDKINTTVKQAYLNKAGDKTDEETITDLMDQESWLTAQECLDYGFCDEVIGEKQIAARFDLSILNNFKNVPETFIREAIKRDSDSEKVKDKGTGVWNNQLPQGSMEAVKERLALEIDLI